MTQSSNKEKNTHKGRGLRLIVDEKRSKPEPPDTPVEKSEFSGMKLIPWRDIWASLTVAKMRGNGEMIEVFYETLFKEAVFDDRGAWSIDLRKHN